MKRFTVTHLDIGYVVTIEHVTSWQAGWDEGKEQEKQQYAFKTFEEVVEQLNRWKGLNR